MAHTILVGDARDQLATLPDQSVQTCVTSPPYYGLRDYGVDGQIGLESSVEEYIDTMVAVFREVRRVLKDDGTCWVNLGDSYAANGTSGLNTGWADRAKDYAGGGHTAEEARERSRKSVPIGLKPKDLIGIPWRVAFALQADGWYLRQDIIWHKPNPLPESVRDRCTKSHEYIFLFSKSPRYYYDADAIAEPVALSTVERLSQPNIENQRGSYRVPGKTNGAMKAVVRKQNTGQRFGGHKYGDDAHEQSRTKSGNVFTGSETRNKRSVWTVSTKPYSGAHFAVFPPEIPETCIKAGSREGDTVLDPFAGSGTTGEVAEFLGRRVILIELNPAYIPLIEKRLAQRTIWDALAVAD